MFADFPEVQGRVPPREVGVLHRPHVHAQGTPEVQIREEVISRRIHIRFYTKKTGHFFINQNAYIIDTHLYTQ